MRSSQYVNPQVVKVLRIRNCESSALKEINPFILPTMYSRLLPSKAQGLLRKREQGKKCKSHRTGRPIKKCWCLDKKWLTHSCRRPVQDQASLKSSMDGERAHKAWFLTEQLSTQISLSKSTHWSLNRTHCSGLKAEVSLEFSEKAILFTYGSLYCSPVPSEFTFHHGLYLVLIILRGIQ